MVAVPALKLPVAWGPDDACGTVAFKKTAAAAAGRRVSATSNATGIESFTENNDEALTARDVDLEVQAVMLGNCVECRSGLTSKPELTNSAAHLVDESIYHYHLFDLRFFILQAPDQPSRHKNCSIHHHGECEAAAKLLES